MAFEAKLFFTDSDGKATGDSLKVLECDFGFTQNVEHLTGEPNAYPMINNISVVIESTNDTQLTDWMVSPKAARDGKIEFNIRNNNKKILKFKEGYCIQYHESFNHLGEESPMHINITISTKSVSIDDVGLSRSDYMP